MTRLTLEAALHQRLLDLREPLEICDPGGKVLAHVLPVPVAGGFEPWEPTFTEEELQETERSTEWFTTEQLQAHLEKL